MEGTPDLEIPAHASLPGMLDSPAYVNRHTAAFTGGATRDGMPASKTTEAPLVVLLGPGLSSQLTVEESASVDRRTVMATKTSRALETAAARPLVAVAPASIQASAHAQVHLPHTNPGFSSPNFNPMSPTDTLSLLHDAHTGHTPLCLPYNTHTKGAAAGGHRDARRASSFAPTGGTPDASVIVATCEDTKPQASVGMKPARRPGEASDPEPPHPTPRVSDESD